MLIYSNSQIYGFMMTRGFVVDVCQLGASPDRHHLGLENFNQTEGCFFYSLEMGFLPPWKWVFLPRVWVGG